MKRHLLSVYPKHKETARDPKMRYVWAIRCFAGAAEYGRPTRAGEGAAVGRAAARRAGRRSVIALCVIDCYSIFDAESQRTSSFPGREPRAGARRFHSASKWEGGPACSR